MATANSGTPNGFSPPSGFPGADSLFDSTPPAEDVPEVQEGGESPDESEETKEEEAKSGDSALSEEPEKEEAEGADEKEADAEEKKPPKEEVKVKPVRGKFEGNNIDVPPQATFPVTIDGKREFVSFQALQSSYAGDSHLKRRHSQLLEQERGFSKERETLKQQQSELRTFVNNVTELAKKEDIWGMLGHFADVAGEDPYEFTYKVRRKVAEAGAAYRELPQAERELLEERTKNEFARQRLERVRARDTQAAELRQIQAQIAEAIHRYEVPSEKEFSEALEQVREGIRTGELTLKQGENVTPDYVARWHYGQHKKAIFQNALEKHGKSLVDDHDKIHQMMVSVIRFQLNDEEIDDFVRKQAGEVDTKTARQLSEKTNLSKSDSTRKPTVKAEIKESDWDWVK